MRQQFMVERAENRAGTKLTAIFIGRHGELGVEKAVTGDISSRGARVISTSEYSIDDTILFSLPAGHFTSAARVVYCDALGQGGFGTGLEFVGSSEPLEISKMNRLFAPVLSLYYWAGVRLAQGTEDCSDKILDPGRGRETWAAERGYFWSRLVSWPFRAWLGLRRAR
jgi:hypothetical protein